VALGCSAVIGASIPIKRPSLSDVPAQEWSEWVVEQHFTDMDLAVRVALFEGLDDGGEVAATGSGGQKPQAEGPFEAVSCRLGLHESAGELLVGGADGGEELLAEGCEGDSSAGSMENLVAEQPLELAQVLADTRGRDAKPFRGVSEVQLLGQRQEHSDLAELNHWAVRVR
jgi:hypothetical protein